LARRDHQEGSVAKATTASRATARAISDSREERRMPEVLDIEECVKSGGYSSNTSHYVDRR
jgi:hypothetical protein